MTTPIKTFSSKITDEYGGKYGYKEGEPQPVVAVRAWSESSQNTGESETCEGYYKIDSEVEAITYKVNYWYSGTTMAEGRRSRPLLNESDDGFTDKFQVDLLHPETIDLLKSPLGHADKMLNVIKHDLVRRFK